MMTELFSTFFTGRRKEYLERAIDFALEEDGQDLTSLGVFSETDTLRAKIVAKEEAILAGLPLMDLVLQRIAPDHGCLVKHQARDGQGVAPGDVVGRISGSARIILKAERVILNYITHLSGIATLTARYVRELEGTRTTLLDTRKTLPCLRYPEKYAVLAGGGANHRVDLEEMLMLKDNHNDRAGSITAAVLALRKAYSPCPPLEVECRTMDEVHEAVGLGVNRIMLDNMNHEELSQALAIIPGTIESEVSGGVNLETIRSIALLGPDYVSVGRLTHSAPSSDFSMRLSLT